MRTCADWVVVAPVVVAWPTGTEPAAAFCGREEWHRGVGWGEGRGEVLRGGSGKGRVGRAGGVR